MFSSKIIIFSRYTSGTYFFLTLKKNCFLKFFLKFGWIYNGILIEKWNFFKNPKLSVYYMCHMCANQFYDSESSIEWYCLKKFNFESIHIRHINFFEFFEIFLKIRLDLKIDWNFFPKFKSMFANRFYDSY